MVRRPRSLMFDVDEEYVFLKLADELDSDETPYVGIAAGESIRDFAGNITSGREVATIRSERWHLAAFDCYFERWFGPGRGP